MAIKRITGIDHKSSLIKFYCCPLFYAIGNCAFDILKAIYRSHLLWPIMMVFKKSILIRVLNDLNEMAPIHYLMVSDMHLAFKLFFRGDEEIKVVRELFCGRLSFSFEFLSNVFSTLATWLLTWASSSVPWFLRYPSSSTTMPLPVSYAYL